MTGADIIGALLCADLTEADPVPADRIKEDRLPDGIALPALLIRTTSSVDRHLLSGAPLRTRDRISVTVRAGSVKERKAVIGWVRARCSGKNGDIAAARSVSILTFGKGPSLNGPGNSFEQTQDFRVSWDAED